MEPPATGYDAIDHTPSSVHDWRVFQLTLLGIPGLLAELSLRLSLADQLQAAAGVLGVSGAGTQRGRRATRGPAGCAS
jgi:hypothetical protein